MKNIFSRKNDTQTGNSKYKFWISGSTNASRPVPIQTDNTRIQADIRTSSRAASATNLRPSAAEDKPPVSVSTGPSIEKTIYPTTRAHTMPQANFHPPPPSSRHRDYHDEPPRAGYPPREDRAKGFRRAPSGNELALKNQTELWPPPQSSKQPGHLDDQYREQPFHEDPERRRYRNEARPEAKYGSRKDSSRAKDSRGGDEDRFMVTRDQFREEYGTIRDWRVTGQRPRDKDRAMESEPEGIRERDKDNVDQKERERQKGEKQQRERERIRQQEMENECERERQNQLERQERQKELEWANHREEREQQRQKEEREREKQRKLEEEREKERISQSKLEREKQRQFQKERERQQELERERLMEERERRMGLEREQRVLEKEREKERERQKELEWEKQRVFERERKRLEELERERHREEERERELQAQKERARRMELEREQMVLEQEREKERERQKVLEMERQNELQLREERERERRVQKERARRMELEREQMALEQEREKERERQKVLEMERQNELQLREERERERRVQKERARRIEFEREQIVLEQEREKERGRHKELEREKQRAFEKERQRQEELERERYGEERERELQVQKEREELEREQMMLEQEREKERERQQELEWERHRERERQLQKERERREELERAQEKERDRQKELERERYREFEQERERQKELKLREERERERRTQKEREKRIELEREQIVLEQEREKERERQKELERDRHREERERELQVQKERERRVELEREQMVLEQEREKERERQKELELREERERERQMQKERERRLVLEREQVMLEKEREKERERQKELEWERHRERERQVQKERERRVELEREQMVLEQEREKERERQKVLEMERQNELQLREERERERQVQKERARRMELEREQVMLEKERERERERQKELERERHREERERELQVRKERARRMELEREQMILEQQREKERERQKELERDKQEREREMRKERARRMEFERVQMVLEQEREKETDRQKELEMERHNELQLREERERERQRQKERERQQQLERQKDLEREKQVMELEREREQARQIKEREWKRETDRERERESEDEKRKELQRLIDLERERPKEVEQEREKESTGKDRGRRDMPRNRARERERQDQEEHNCERVRHDGREREKGQELFIISRDLDHGVDPAQQDFDYAEGTIKAGLQIVDVKPVGDGEYRSEKAVQDPRQGQEHSQQARARAEAMDGTRDRLRTRTDRERRKEGKLGRQSVDQPSLSLRTFRQFRHERPVADGWGDSSDDSVDHMLIPQSGPKHDRTGDEKLPIPQFRHDNPAGSSGILAHGKAPINLLPPFATPRAAPIPLASIDPLPGRQALPLASLVNIGAPRDIEPARREINRSRLNREDAEPLKPTESSRPPSRVSLVQGTNPVQMQITPSQAQITPAQLGLLHVKARLEDLSAPIEPPVYTVLNSWSNVTTEGSQFPPEDRKGLKSFPDPSMETSKQVPYTRQMGSSQRNDKGKRTTPDTATHALPKEAHPTQMQSEEKVPHIAPPQVQYSIPPSVSMDGESRQASGSAARPTAATIRMRESSVIPIPNPLTFNSATVSSTIPSVDPCAQVLASLSPPSIPHRVNYQPTRNVSNPTTVCVTPATQNPSYGSLPAVPTATFSQNPKDPSPTSGFPSPPNTASVPLPDPSSGITGLFPAPSVNAPPQIRLPQSSASVPTSAQMSSLPIPPSSARQWVINTPTTSHTLLPINVGGPGRNSNHSPGTRTYNAEPSSETIPPLSEVREPNFPNASPIPRATFVPTALKSSLAQVETVPQIQIRRPVTADGAKQGKEVLPGTRSPMFSAPETAAAISTPTMPPTSQILEVRPKASFSKGLVGVSNAKSQPRNQHNKSPEIKLVKVDDVPVSSFAASAKLRSDDFEGQAKKRSSNRESPRIKKAEPSLTRVLLRETEEPGKRKPSSKESPKKVMAIIGEEGVSKQDVHVAGHVFSSRQDYTEQLRSSKLSTQQLPVISHQAGYDSDVPQTKIQHPILAELLSSPQPAPVISLTPVQVLDKGHPKEENTVHLTTPNIQLKFQGTPPERHRQELDHKMQFAKESAPNGRSSHRKFSSTTFRTVELPPLREHHQLRTAADIVTRAKLVRTTDQAHHEQRKNTLNSNPTQPSHSRIVTQEPNSNHRIPESQRGTTKASRPVKQPLQHGRHRHSVSLPTSSTVLKNPLQDLPGSNTPSDYAKQALPQGRPVMGHFVSDKDAFSAPPAQGTVPTSASLGPSLTLKQTDSRHSNAEPVNSQTGKKIRRFRLPSTKATPAQSSQVWHPGTSLKTPNSSPSQANGTPLEHNLNPKEPNETQSVPFPVPKSKDAEAAIAPFHYLTHRNKRSVSGASMEARYGTAPSTVLGSPNASMHSATPLPPPPTRDTWKATHDWISEAEDRAQSRPRRKRPRPGVVFDTDEDAPEDKQRPRRTLTKHRSTAARHESSNS